ncbi:FAD-dependent oxidoreductase [Exiguobacterium sp. SL14]|nr:FAD-dependent oxidoreductase [Exiguobacterium sp. SL14]MCY1691600.1 FAD-dependent oxidoreductase [Exiguobacterium sp. SL14]
MRQSASVSQGSRHCFKRQSVSIRRFATRSSKKSGPGVRPQTISGLPYIGVAASARRIFLATGHHRHGILLAPATAEVLSATLRLIQKEEVR